MLAERCRLFSCRIVAYERLLLDAYSAQELFLLVDALAIRLDLLSTLQRKTDRSLSLTSLGLNFAHVDTLIA